MKEILVAACLSACSGFGGNLVSVDFSMSFIGGPEGEPCHCRDEVGKFRTVLYPAADDFAMSAGVELDCGIDDMNDNRGIE